MARSSKKEKNPLTNTLGNPAKLKVLDFLMKSPSSDYSISQIAKGAGIGRTTLFRIFDSMEKLNMVKKTRVIGNAKLYALNIGNPVVKHLSDIYVSIYTSLTEENKKAEKEKPKVV